MGKGDAQAELEPLDKRLQWIEQRLLLALKLKPVEMKKFMDSEDHRQLLLEFVDQPDRLAVFIVGNAAGAFTVVSSEFDALHGRVDVRRKIFYLLKLKKGKMVDEKQLSTEVAFGDVNVDVLQSLHDLSQSVLLPLIGVRPNAAKVADVNYPFLIDQTHSFLAQSLMTLGRSHHQTLLPLPAVTLPKKILPPTRESVSIGKELLFELENAAVLWSQSIRGAIASSPDDIHVFLGRLPGPLDEIAFWRKKMDNLAQLEKQLCQPFIAKTLVVLKYYESSYYPAFSALSHELHNSYIEAAESHRFLKPMTELFEAMNVNSSGKVEFAKLAENGVFRRTFQLLYIVWCHSTHYSTLPRMVNLISEICNDLILSARDSINVPDIFICDNEDIVKHIVQVLHVCGEFKNAFFHYKARSAKELQRPWRFQNTALFKRLDSFLERLHDLLDVHDTSLLFFRMSNIRVGGPQSVELSAEIDSVQSKFFEHHSRLQNLQYDLLDVGDGRFEGDYDAFRTEVNSLEARLGTVLAMGCDDASSLVTLFKVVDSFEGFTERPVLHQEWARRQNGALKAWHRELLTVKEHFDTNKDAPPPMPNMPPTSSAVVWGHALSARIATSAGRISELNKAVLHSEAGEEALKLYELLRSQLRSFIHTTYDAWAATVGQISADKLRCRLLAKAVNGEYIVNFDPELVKTLKEVRHFEVLTTESDDPLIIPPQVVTLNKSREVLRSHVLRLDYVCTTTNEMERTLLPSERVLFEKELAQLHVNLSKAVDELQWHTSDICEQYIVDVVQEVQLLERTVDQFHRNLNTMRDLFRDFSAEDKLLPLVASKTDVRIFTEVEFRKRWADHMAARELKIKGISEHLQRLMRESLEALNAMKRIHRIAEVKVESAAWSDYVAYATEEVTAMLAQCAVSSLTHIRDQLDDAWLAAHGGMPLMDIKLTITRPRDLARERPTIVFDPPLSHPTSLPTPSGVGGGASGQLSSAALAASTSATLTATSAAALHNLEAIIDNMIHGILGLASQVLVLDEAAASTGMSFLSQVCAEAPVMKLQEVIHARVRKNNALCVEHISQFEEYSALYREDMNQAFRVFMEDRAAAARNAKNPASPSVASNAAAAMNAPRVGSAATTGNDDSAGAASSGIVDANRRTPDEYFGGVTLRDFDSEIRRYEALEDELEGLPSATVIGFVKIDSKPIKAGLMDLCTRWRDTYLGYLTKKIINDLTDLYAFIHKADKGLNSEVVDGDLESLKTVMRCIRDCRRMNDSVAAMMEPVTSAALMLRQHPNAVNAQTLDKIEELRKPVQDAWSTLYRTSLNVREQNSTAQDREAERMKEDTLAFEERIAETGQQLRCSLLYTYSLDAGRSYQEIDNWSQTFRDLEQQAKFLWDLQELFELTASEFKELRECRTELAMLKHMWDLVNHVTILFKDWMTSTFASVDVDSFLDEIKKLLKQLKAQPMKAKAWAVYKGLEETVGDMNKSLPLCAELRSPSMRARHWDELLRVSGRQGSIDPASEEFTLERLIALGVHRHAEVVYNIVEKSQKELLIERSLTKIMDAWEKLAFSYDMNTGLDVFLLAPVDLVVEQLEADSNTLQAMLSNRFVDFFLSKVQMWQRNLGTVDTCMNKWVDIQRKWVNLYPIFVLSADIREQLPEDARNFQIADELFRGLMRVAHNYTNVVEVLCTNVVLESMQRSDDLESLLGQMEDILVGCEKSLSEYLETKRKIFPRFFFVSSADLVDILSKGSDPSAVMVHMSKIVDSIETFSIDNNPNNLPQGARRTESPTTPSLLQQRVGTAADFQGLPTRSEASSQKKTVWEIISVQSEKVRLPQEYCCEGPVELWLAGCIEAMQQAIRYHIQDAWQGYIDRPRTEWIYLYPCQAIIVASRSWFTQETQSAFQMIEEGTETAMKDFLKSQKTQLDTLIKEVLLDRNKNDRKMLVHLITIDVHNRDIIQTLVDDKIDSVESFAWQSQLRYYWDDKRGSEIRICDAEFVNGYEYIGLCGCLVITKLTDRCYTTLSQALRLKKGGAPAGPAGTGKTETTKDLARNLGIACYVFNCSDQMNYITLGQIFKGLAMSGSWGCFDEFNRISIEVLSVVATQVGSILNALKAHKREFRFMDEKITVCESVGMFITMNPGYAGRTELPENIKSLFRPCAMCVPDLKNICEIMLAAEGFGDAKDLSLKFVTLYGLNKELLSPQDHYDWGLRAVKSVLYIAGALKRGDPDVPERKVLMRALRDTNLAKLSKDDVYVFMGLIRALFPQLEAPKKDKPELVDALRRACTDLGLFTGENDIFILKCVQYEEILHVRHSVFILGPAGCGKTQCWKCLQNALHKLGDKCSTQVLNPKAITSNELYGYIHPQTKEWRDGVLSNIFRAFALESKTKKNSKWIVLDGIIDAEWIESMNTVMDDNKMLTLVSNERIPLTESMRMIFEVSHLKNASPATVSRAGVVFINESDLGWAPFKDRWLAKRSDERERTHLETLFDRYVPNTLDYWKRTMKPIVSVMDINVVQTICFLLEGLLDGSSGSGGNNNTAPPQSAKEHGSIALPRGSERTAELYEKYFVFAVVWAFGGPLPSDGRIDYRAQFSTWWRKENPVFKMGETGTVFDTFIDVTDNYEYKPWSAMVARYEHDPDVPLGSVTVQTADTCRMGALMSLLMDRGNPVMLVGTAGTGKSNLIMSKLRTQDSSQILFRVIAFNARTNSMGLQAIMEQSLEKRSGRQFGPVGRKKLIFFLDDVNMPNPDKYGTQEAIALLQQHYNYGFWYDRAKMTQKDVVDLRYVAAMNPKSGTFTILDRLLRHFALFSTNMPDKPDLVRIYGQILAAHYAPFSRDVKALVEVVANATIDLQLRVIKEFLPTAVLFHYQWNMRELFNIFQGLCKAHIKLHNEPTSIVRLWCHEVVRTFRDRMPNESDTAKFDEILLLVERQYFPDFPHDALIDADGSNMWAPFTTTKDGEENTYDAVNTKNAFAFLSNKLNDYNTTLARMDLVLFQQAMEHVCRIARVTSNPAGNALLVGVGGSGKQSLARLASFINGLEIFQILVTSTYGIAEFRADTQELYKKAGLKGNAYSFIITDQQIVSMDMLVYLNDMLNSGNVPDLFTGDERDSIIGSIMNEVKATGHPDYSNPDVCWSYFISKVRSNLHIVLCFSPVGATFASWCRQFPALANTTVIDWFHSWPLEALQSVARRFLEDVDLGEEDVKLNVAEFMAFCQESVVQQAKDFYSVAKRRCYTTPKSFLELINLYKDLLARKRGELSEKSDRLVTGIEKIREAASQVAELQTVLHRESLEVDEAREKTAKLMEHVGRERAIVEEQSAIAEVEEVKTNKIVVEVEAFASECARDLAAARPLVEEALAALNTLDKSSLTELKSMGKPPEDVVMVCTAVRCLTSDPRRIPPPKARDWANCKQMMANITQWMKDLLSFDQDNIPQACIDAIQVYVTNPNFEPSSVVTKSFAASGLCKWVIGMNKYHVVRCEVRPKEERLAEAQERLATSKTALKKIQDKVAELKSKLDVLVRQYTDAVATANGIEARAKKTKDKMSLAERLVGGLADEKVRWGKTIEELKHRAGLLVGDVLLGAAFVSYIGPFTREFRESIVHEVWKPEITNRGIPLTKGFEPVLGVLTTEAEVASWNNEGLPNDAVSTQNGAVINNCSRWPLMIDPQLQGVRWIKMREEKRGLVVVQPGSAQWLAKVVRCVEEGLPCLIESCGENLDPVLDNLLGRVTYRRGEKTMIRIGAQDVEFSKSFKLVLQTKLSNPHYKPEINAQTTLINFMVTEVGLEDQLLAVVVNQERPDLEEKRVTLLRHMNTMTIELQQCEDGLLFELSNAQGDILENVALVENLEVTKKKALEISRSMHQAVETQATIAKSRQTYQTVAARGALLFFQIDQLGKIDHMYQYSLEAFMVVFHKALTKAAFPEPRTDVAQRVLNVMKSITESVFAYVARGLFERHKLIFSSLLTFAILSKANDVDRRQMDFLLRGKRKLNVDRPETVQEWCTEPNWAAVQALAEVEGSTPSFSLLPADMAESNRWRMWCESEKPEEEKMPTEWKNITPFQRLLVLRCLRPDRLTAALESFVAATIGKFFVSDQAVDVSVSFQDAGCTTPLFFILSAGVDPVKNVETLGVKLGYTYDNEKLYNVSLGQGQEIVAERALMKCFKDGGWVMLNNVHLVEKWLVKLEKMLEANAEVYKKMEQVAKRKAERRMARRMAWLAEHPEHARAAGFDPAAAAAAHHHDTEAEGGNGHDAEHAEDATGDEGNAAGVAATTSPAAAGAASNSGGNGAAASGDGANSRASGGGSERTDAERGNAGNTNEDGEGESVLEPEPNFDSDKEDEAEAAIAKGHLSFRIFLSAEPSNVIPIGILQSSIKLTSEPPTGINQNVKRALMNFSDEPWERSTKPTEFRAVMFAMCFFHAVVVERKKFGPQGWNRVYPFNVGDLTTCVDVLGNYIDDRPKVPWEDLRYVFGEIMYGGHITDDWDRVLCMAYLRQWIVPEVVDTLDLAPNFPMPPPLALQEYFAYVDENCPQESPVLYGLHPNAEINFRSAQADVLFRTINELQPKQQGGDAGASPQELVRSKLVELLERLPEPFALADIGERLDEDRTPPQHVFYQECERINILILAIRRSLQELLLGLQGALSMTNTMQQLFDQLFMDNVPEPWAKVSFASMRPLPSWFDNMLSRFQQLSDWTGELVTPKVTILSFFFNPMSLVTAIMQHTAMANNFDLDQMALIVDVTKKVPEQIDIAARDGAHVYGMCMEGARWDQGQGAIDDARMKELYPKLPVVTIRSQPASKVDRKDQYECPLYKTQQRGPGFVVGMWLRTKQPSRKWVIAGVGLLLDVVE